MHGEARAAAFARRTADQNITFAVPLPIVEGVAANVMYFESLYGGGAGCVRRPSLGVTTRSEDARYEYDADVGHGHTVCSVTVDTVGAGSIAASLGLRAEDVLLSVTIGGRTFALDRLYSLDDALLWARPGDELTVRYARGGTERETSAHTLTAAEFSAVK